MVSTPESTTPEGSSPAGPTLSGVGPDEVLVVPVQVGPDYSDPVGSGAGRLGTVGGGCRLWCAGRVSGLLRW